MPRFLSSQNVLLAVVLVLAGCANPVPPTGGPRDQIPPRISSSRPAAEAIRVSGQTVRIAFNEYVDRSSLREALTVTPAPSAPLTFDWSRRGVEIDFPEPFRDSTTYLLVIDKTLQDIRGVALEEPITLAFSTGDEIDSGRLSGRLIGASWGAPREGFDVYAYAAEAAQRDSLPEAPLYRTQTGPDGTFDFSYLREDLRYYVVALRDRNRNYRADPLEAFAAPPRPALSAQSDRGDARDRAGGDLALETAEPVASGADAEAPPGGTTSSEASWVAGAQDPVPPRLTRALALSRQRLAVRFSEPVRLQNRRPGRFTLTDTTTGRAVPVRRVYRRPEQTQRVVLRTDSMQPVGHRVQLAEGAPVVVDTSGNAPARPAEATFTAAERPDTLGLRFLGFQRVGDASAVSGSAGDTLMLAPGQDAAVQFNQPPADDSVATSPPVPADSVQRDTTTTRFPDARALLSVRDAADDRPLAFDLRTDDGTTYRVVLAAPLAPEQTARLRVDARALRPPADTVYTQYLRRLPPDALGAVSGTVRIAQASGGSDAADLAPVTADTAPAADSVTADSVVADPVAADTLAVDTAATDAVASDSAAASAVATGVEATSAGQMRLRAPGALEDAGPVIVELYAAEGTEVRSASARPGAPLRTTRTDSSGRFLFEELPEASYRFRAFLDSDDDGTWSAGRLAPYRPAEPLAWSGQPVEARPRWETADDDTLRLVYGEPPLP